MSTGCNWTQNRGRRPLREVRVNYGRGNYMGEYITYRCGPNAGGPTSPASSIMLDEAGAVVIEYYSGDTKEVINPGRVVYFVETEPSEQVLPPMMEQEIA